MSDYLIPDGPLDKAYAALAATGWKLNLQSAHRPGPKGNGDPSKTPYVCRSCGFKIWGKPDIDVICESCAADGLPDIADQLIPYRMDCDR